jgi:hypothetical protein
VSALEAGRELDALIAEKVMGFAWEIFPDDRYAIMRVPGTNWCAADHSYGDDGTRYTEFLALHRPVLRPRRLDGRASSRKATT